MQLKAALDLRAPEAVAGCDDSRERADEDRANNDQYRGRCLHCRQGITVKVSVQGRRAVPGRARPCPHCRKQGW